MHYTHGSEPAHSGTGIREQWLKRFGNARELPEIIADYRQNSKDAVDFMTDFFDVFGRSVANIINILDPDIVIVGGGVSNIHELYTEGRKYVGKYVFNDTLETSVVQHMLGDSAGVLGAATIGI